MASNLLALTEKNDLATLISFMYIFILLIARSIKQNNLVPNYVVIRFFRCCHWKAYPLYVIMMGYISVVRERGIINYTVSCFSFDYRTLLL